MLEGDRRLYFGFLFTHGLEFNKYRRILEVGTYPTDCMSRYLPKEYTFILDEELDYALMKDLELYGARGFVSENGIVIPNEEEARGQLQNYCPRLYNSRVPLYSSFHVPSIHGFDAAISPIDYKYIDNLASFRGDLYVGAILDLGSQEVENSRIELNSLMKKIYDATGEHSTVYEENLPTLGKDILILKKNGNK